MDAPMQVLSKHFVGFCRTYRGRAIQGRRFLSGRCLRSVVNTNDNKNKQHDVRHHLSALSQNRHSYRLSSTESVSEGVNENIHQSNIDITDSRNITLEERKETPRVLFRTKESNPLNHDINHEGLYYTVPEDFRQETDFNAKVLPFQFRQQADVFNETCIMVRKPAIEIFEYIKNSNLKLPMNKFMLYGDLGHGKTMILAHAHHYFQNDGWITIHAPWPSHWSKQYQEMALSRTYPDKYDIPVEVSAWLKYFKQQNGRLLEGLKTTERYEWSVREETELGSELTELIELGITRKIYSCEVVDAVFKELKRYASEGRIKVAVLVDGVNGLWHPGNISVGEDEYEPLDPAKVTIIHHFRQLLKADWNGGIAVCVADEHASPKTEREKITPRYLLTKEGFEWLEPFVPVHVPRYNDKEVYTCLEYYIDREWIQNKEGRTENGKKQIMFLSQRNPYRMMEVVDPW